LFGGQPVAKSDSQFFHTLHPTDAGRQIRTEKSAVRRFIGKPTHGSEPQVDRSGREFPGFEMNTIPEHYGLVEGKAKLRAIPVHELIDGVPVSALGLGAIQAIENGGFSVIEVGQSKDSLRSPA